MKSFDYTIRDEIGIHARPAGALAKLAKQFSSKITISKGDNTVNAEKLMMLMGLGIKQGDTVTVCVVGEDEELAAESIKGFFEDNL